MRKIDWFKLWLFDRREYALQVLIEPIRAEIGRRERQHAKVSHLYKQIKDLRNLHLTGRYKP